MAECCCCSQELHDGDFYICQRKGCFGLAIAGATVEGCVTCHGEGDKVCVLCSDFEIRHGGSAAQGGRLRAQGGIDGPGQWDGGTEPQTGLVRKVHHCPGAPSVLVLVPERGG